MIHSNVFPALLALQALGGGSMPVFIFEFVAIFGIFYFLLIRPQQQQKKQHENSLTKLKRGDQIVTAGGIVGEVIHIKEASAPEGKSARSLEDHVTIKSAESRMVVERGRIVRIMGSTSAPTSARE